MVKDLELIDTAMLHGPVAHIMDLTHQMIWWKLVGLALQSTPVDGVLRHGRGPCMTRSFIEHSVGCTTEQLDMVISIAESYQHVGADGCGIKVWEDGTIQLTNLGDYLPKGKVEAISSVRR